MDTAISVFWDTMNDPTYALILSIFAVYRVTWLVTKENGPRDVFAKFRNAVRVAYGDESWQYDGIQCVLCVSFWVVWIIAILPMILVGMLGITGIIAVAHRALPQVRGDS